MSDKAIVSRRDVPKEQARVMLQAQADVLGFSIERELPHGTLVQIDDNQRVSLNALGFRVKVLPNTNILQVGVYEINAIHDVVHPPVPASLEIPAVLANTWTHHLVQLVAPQTDDWIQQIEERGITVVEPVSDYGLFVVGSPTAVATLKQQVDFIQWIGPLKPAYKLHPNLNPIPSSDDGSLRLDISIYPSSDAAEVTESLATLGAIVIRSTPPLPDYEPDFHTLIVDVDPDHIADIARMPSVRWVETVGRESRLDGERDTQVVAGNIRSHVRYQEWLKHIGISGTGVVIAICDRGVDENRLNNISGHPDLRGRQREFLDYSDIPDVTDTSGHGTVVASIAVGNAATGERDRQNFFLGQGVAPAARYLTQNFLLGKAWPSDFRELTYDAITHDACVLNNSWSDTTPLHSGYTQNALAFDRLVRHPTGLRNDARELVIVFAAGNMGSDPGTIESPKEAKNPIIVGASLSWIEDNKSTQGIWHSSSRGPALDERILPTVVAPGSAVTGALSASSAATPINPRSHYVKMEGTSMAAPFVAGCCALLIEWWRGRNNDRDPSPAMLKALLVNGADDIEVGGDGETGTRARIPNNHQGWGRVNLRNILEEPSEFPDAARGPRICIDQEIAFNEDSDDYVIDVRTHDENLALRVTLVWTDAPGNDPPSRALANDLDLEVFESSTGTRYNGNHFRDGYLYSDASREPDRLNNVECVYIERPRGAYEVRVIPSGVTRNARPPFRGAAWQDFALVIENGVAGAL